MNSGTDSPGFPFSSPEVEPAEVGMSVGDDGHAHAGPPVVATGSPGHLEDLRVTRSDSPLPMADPAPRQRSKTRTRANRFTPRPSFVVDDFAGSTATVGLLPIPGSMNGRLERRGDRDWFRLNLIAGRTYQFRQNRVTLRDPYLRLLNAAGALIRANNNDGFSRNSLITFTPSSSGIYYLDAGSFQRRKRGSYTISATVSVSVLDDFAGSSATTGLLAIPGSLNGNLETRNDRDWFRLNLTAGQTYTFNLDSGTLTDPYLRLRNSVGTEIAFDDDSGEDRNSLITLIPPSSGPYYLEAGSFNDSGSGTYMVSASVSVLDDYAGSTATTGVLGIPESLNGNLETNGDRDWLRLNLTAGQIYEFGLNGITLENPYLRLRNSLGAEIAFNDDDGSGSSNSLLIFQPTSSGTYYLDAGSHLDTGVGSYSMTTAFARDGCIDADGDFQPQMNQFYDETLLLDTPDDTRAFPFEEIVEGRPYSRVVLGTRFDDTLIGSDFNDIIIPGEGSDSIVGGGGADIFFIKKEVWNDEIDLKNRIGDFSQSQGDIILLGKDLFDGITGLSSRPGSGINNPVNQPRVGKSPRITFPAAGENGTNEGWETLFIESFPGQTSVADKDAIAHINVAIDGFDINSVFLLC